MREVFKKNAVLVDVDGTLAKMKRGPGERSPYDWHRVGEDLPNKPIVELVKILSKHYEIIILTGRDGSALQDTNEWLALNHVPYTELHIRPAGNNEKDSVIKHRILTEHVLPNYNVEFVLDDRDQVVDMWRAIGLTCLQVDYGKF